MPIKKIIKGKVPVKIYTDDIDDNTQVQLENLSQLPFIHKHIACMPDVHGGKGSTIGSVIPTKQAIIPAAVGVDIGCGMMACQLNITSKDLPDNLNTMRSEIEKAVPHGRTDNGGRNDRGAWHIIPSHIEQRWSKVFSDKLESIAQKHPMLLRKHTNTFNHLGTLGTGNHFIEICLDEKDNVWVMLHSGSRGIGNRIGSYFISLAKEEMKRWFINLPDKDLSYFPEGSQYFNDYIEAVNWAQEYALQNRELMMKATIDAISKVMKHSIVVIKTGVNCHHNYVEQENHYNQNVWLTRKGAIRAREGDLGIIPGSMGTKSFIVKGKGNKESFNSCSHGAGRKMSRTEAKKQFTIEDLKAQTKGIECRKDKDVIDEIPQAYKDINEVMENQSDLVEVVHTLKQVVNVKG